MSTNESDKIYTNITDNKTILTHSKEGNTTGKNTSNTIHDLIKKLNNDQKKRK